ncbi:hypothetical protein [Nitratireductor sp. XY-223]|uniref:hypothetical protein n=1 Tax=Nitratireductor sp. XY-223 TaxID=2561926 RepID=UPI0010AB048C|nr:hypothetical protein [Nitratireductor sp. XY-223]
MKFANITSDATGTRWNRAYPVVSHILNGGNWRGGNPSTGTGADTLEGGKGNDELWGGGGADYFNFGSGDGTDTIKDFEDGKDTLVIKGGLQFSDLDIKQSGHDTVITGYGENDSITLEGVSASTLTDSDFDFIA